MADRPESTGGAGSQPSAAPTGAGQDDGARTGGWRLPGRLALFLAAVAVVVLGLRAWPGGALRFGWARGPGTGDPAPAIEARTLAGRRLSLSQLRGRVVLVNFWATWCGPCRAEMPALERLWQERGRDGFVVLGLSDDESPGDVLAYVADRSVTYPIAFASAAQKRDYAVTALPTSYLLDRAGRVRYMVYGAYPEAMLRDQVARLLTEGPNAPPAALPGLR